MYMHTSERLHTAPPPFELRLAAGVQCSADANIDRQTERARRRACQSIYACPSYTRLLRLHLYPHIDVFACAHPYLAKQAAQALQQTTTSRL